MCNHSLDSTTGLQDWNIEYAEPPLLAVMELEGLAYSLLSHGVPVQACSATTKISPSFLPGHLIMFDIIFSVSGFHLVALMSKLVIRDLVHNIGELLQWSFILS